MVLSRSVLSRGDSHGLWDDFWAGHNTKDLDSWAKRRILKILSLYIKPGTNILDAGSGSGFFSSYFISRNCSTYSMDYSLKALSFTKDVTRNKSKMYLKADILNKDSFSELGVKFDIIFTDGLLEHYSRDEQEEIIKNMRDMKKENGYIINFVPNRFSFWSLVRPFFIRIKETPFSMSGFLDLHKRSGLSVVSYGGISVLPFRFSPERLLGKYAGMLFYCVAK